MPKHLVWDWNGTLLDDYHAVVHAANKAVIAFGGTGLDAETHRERFRRPLTAFYSEQVGRELSATEFVQLNDMFHTTYHGRLPSCRLSTGALEAIDAWTGTQSLLSMFPHTHLIPLITELGLLDRFARVDGLRDGADAGKHRYLVDHLSQLKIQASDVVMIGDSLDDAEAAVAAGAACVLVTGGTTATRHLKSSGHPVAQSLAQAVELAKAA